MTEPWLAVRVDPSGDPQSVIDALFEAGSQGVQEDGGSIITHFAPGTSPDFIARAVKSVDASAAVTVSAAPVADWSEWRASVTAHRIGSLRITPPWLVSGNHPLEVVIDPAMAFGTGEHATTRGVVRLMHLLPSMPETVADLGAGSAVLAICAARLGANRVAAIELDADAIGNAEENVNVNGVSDVVRVIEGDAAALLPLVAPVGLVLANIISSVLLEILPVIADSLAPGGHAILSGILAEERSTIVEGLERGGWEIISDDLEDNWWSVLVTRAR